MLIWYFSNNLDIYDFVGKLPKQHFNVWLLSNPRDKSLFLLKFNEAKISELTVKHFRDNHICHPYNSSHHHHNHICKGRGGGGISLMVV